MIILIINDMVFVNNRKFLFLLIINKVFVNKIVILVNINIIIYV